MEMFRVAMVCLHGCPLSLPSRGQAGGMQVHVRELAQSLGRLGFGVDIFTVAHPPHGPGVQPMELGVRVIHLENTSDTPDLSLGYISPLTSSLLRFQRKEALPYHLVHSHYWASAQAGAEAARGWGVPHIVTFHTLGLVKTEAGAGPEPARRGEVERQAVSQASAIVATTQEEKDLLCQLYGADPARVEVIPCGLDLELFQPQDRAASRRALRLPSGKLILYAGRLDPIKRLGLALRAVALLKGEATLVLVGGEPASRQGRELRALAHELGLALIFRRACPRERMPLYYSAADVFLIPSLYESFSLAAAEALACGTPVVATRAGGLKALVRHGHNGLLVAEGRPHAFARALRKVLEEEALAQPRFIGAARASVLALSWDRVARQMADLYHKIKAARRSSLDP